MKIRIFVEIGRCRRGGGSYVLWSYGEVSVKMITPAGTGGASKTATGMAHFSIMWQAPRTMADEAFPGV